VRVAVVDSGWDATLALPGLKVEAGISVGPDGTLGTDAPLDRLGHGTACLCTAFMIAPGAAYLPVRVFADRLETRVAALVAALGWSVRAGCDVVNLSLGATGAAGAEALYHACEAARLAGSVVVAATAPGAGSLPARFDNVLSVDAVDGGGPFDYRYRPDEAVECLASHGIYGLVPWLGGEFVPARGPSYAAPVVSGMVALLRERHPGAPLDRVRALLARHSTPPASGAFEAPQDQVGHESLFHRG
jgi:membrane-anchored mycosin MYCP